MPELVLICFMKKVFVILNGAEEKKMKKILILLTFVLTLVSETAFANVDSGPDRWQQIGSDDMAKVYYDRETVKFYFDGKGSVGDFAEVWLCYHFHDGCQNHAGDHYDFQLIYINYKDSTFDVKAYLTKDKNGKLVEEHEFSPTVLQYSPLRKGSYEALAAQKVKEQFVGKK